MLSEFVFPPRVADCCIHSNWCCNPVPSSRIDGLNLLGSCSGRHDRAGTTTGAFCTSDDNGAGPSANSGVPLVDGGIELNGSVMTNLDYADTSLGEREPSEIRKECSSEEVAISGTMGHAAKENVGRQTVKAGKTTALKRTFQDRPEAPLRKRVHVCGSKFVAAEGMNGTDAGAGDSTGGTGFTNTFYSSMQGINADAGEEGAPKAMGKCQGERIIEVEKNVVDEDVEMTEVDESGERTPIDTCLPRVGGTSSEETKEDCDARALGVESGDSLRPVKLTGVQIPDSALDSTRQEGEPQHCWEGMCNGVFPCRESDSGEDSARVLPSVVPEGIGEISLGAGQQMHDLLGSENGRGDEPYNAIGEESFERRDEFRVVEEDLSQHVELSSEYEPRSRNVPPEDVEVIEVDDSDDDPLEMNSYESDGSSTKGTRPVTRPYVSRNGFRLSTSRSTSASFSPDEESDSDDCQVVGEWKPNVNVNSRRQQKNEADSEGQDDDSDTGDDRSEESDSSDVQVAGGPHSEIQRGWEEAAMRRRMGRAMKSAGSKVNGEREATADLDLAEGAKSEGLAESVATSAYRDSPESTAESSEARGGAATYVNTRDGHAGANLAPMTEGRLHETLDKSGEVLRPGTEANEEGYHRQRMMNGGENPVRVASKELNGHESNREEPLSSIDVRITTASELRLNHVGAGDCLDKGDLIALRERLKQTPEFMQADELEWASRQQELLRQQQEAQKLRQRKRVEADRKLEMERKQKLRVLELRQSQMKAEKDMTEKEQLRGHVRERLEYLASRCTDLASLLRRLGINVDGGNNPSDQQVNAAFKRALVKFHPDRIVDGDARRLVEAEETFKLINRMKKTLDGACKCALALEMDKHFGDRTAERLRRATANIVVNCFRAGSKSA